MAHRDGARRSIAPEQRAHDEYPAIGSVHMPEIDVWRLQRRLVSAGEENHSPEHAEQHDLMPLAARSNRSPI